MDNKVAGVIYDGDNGETVIHSFPDHLIEEYPKIEPKGTILSIVTNGKQKYAQVSDLIILVKDELEVWPMVNWKNFFPIPENLLKYKDFDSSKLKLQ